MTFAGFEVDSDLVIFARSSRPRSRSCLQSASEMSLIIRRESHVCERKIRKKKSWHNFIYKYYKDVLFYTVDFSVW